MSENAIDDGDWLMEGWEEAAEPGSRPVDVPQPTLGDEPPVDDDDAADDEDDREQQETPEEAEEEEEADEESDEEETDEEEEGKDGDEEDAFVVAGFDTRDPDVRAFLAQYGDDPVKALQAAAHLRRAYDRQGTDLGAVRQKAEELEAQIARARMLGGSTPLSEDQHQWAEAAASTAAPGAYIQQAIEAGEYELARAVCSYWGRESPYEAARAGMVVDQVEQQAAQRETAPVEAPTEDIIEALKTNVPGFREWEPQIVRVFENLGPGHHLVQEARSNNVDVAMRALMNLYEIAQASTASVREQRSEIQKRVRRESARAKADAAVTSGANSTSQSKETPRRELILPGLTQEDLDTEFAAQS